MIAAVAVTRALDGQYAGIDKRLSNAEKAIKALSDKQDQSTQNLIHDLLATSATSSDIQLAKKSITVAAQFTVSLREQKKPSPPEFFETAVDKLKQNKNPDLQTPVFNTALELAEYRSSLLPIHLPGSTIICSGPAASGESWSPVKDFSDITFKNCPQVLDGTVLRNVVFVNSKISYHGGSVFMQNVTFVNCTFVVEQTPKGTEFLEAQALGKTNLTIG